MLDVKINLIYLRKAIYTCITGNYDSLKEPVIVTPGWKYICYTSNRALRSNVWEIRVVELNNIKDQRKIKILPPFEYDLCIWIDGSIEIECNLDEFVREKHQGQFTLMKHPHRDCFYQEAHTCIKLGKDSQKVIEAQVLKYVTAKLPRHNGMVATGILIRENNSNVNKFCSLWWQEIEKFSHRDQLSFNFVHTQYPIQYNLIPFDILRKEFLLCKHNK